MSTYIYFDLPKEFSAKETQEILNEIRDINGIEDSGLEKTRAIDPASIAAYITLATSAITLIEKCRPVVEKILDLFKKKGLKNVKITFNDGTQIKVKDGTSKDVEKIASTIVDINKSSSEKD